MEGRATLTIVLSSPTISRLMQQIARMRYRRRRLGSGIPTSASVGTSSLLYDN
jgi:hypothetical protein